MGKRMLSSTLGYGFGTITPPRSICACASIRSNFLKSALGFLTLASVFQFVALARGYDLGRIDRLLVDLLFENLAVFSD